MKHKKEIVAAGVPLATASQALIMVHGRGASAEDILGLASHLALNDCALLAPQATNYTWYPYSFLAPVERNEPWLSSALALLDEVVDDVRAAGIADDKIFFAGFSQGACLTLEYTARRARRWAGIAAFTGGLIGDRLNLQQYTGDFQGTRVFIGSADPDPHVPVSRVRESAGVLLRMHADVMEQIYLNMGHTISEDEIRKANEWVFQ